MRDDVNDKDEGALVLLGKRDQQEALIQDEDGMEVEDITPLACATRIGRKE